MALPARRVRAGWTAPWDRSISDWEAHPAHRLHQLRLTRVSQFRTRRRRRHRSRAILTARCRARVHSPWHPPARLLSRPITQPTRQPLLRTLPLLRSRQPNPPTLTGSSRLMRRRLLVAHRPRTASKHRLDRRRIPPRRSPYRNRATCRLLRSRSRTPGTAILRQVRRSPQHDRLSLRISNLRILRTEVDRLSRRDDPTEIETQNSRSGCRGTVSGLRSFISCGAFSARNRRSGLTRIQVVVIELSSLLKNMPHRR